MTPARLWRMWSPGPKLTPGALLFDLPAADSSNRPDLPEQPLCCDRPSFTGYSLRDFPSSGARIKLIGGLLILPNLFSIPVIRVTGTCGKTRPKMIRHI